MRLKRLLGMCLAVMIVISSISSLAMGRGDDLKGHWSEGVFRSYMEQTFIKGYEDGSIRPDGDITRAEFSAIVNRVIRPVLIANKEFPDVEDGAWYENEILKAATIGYMDVYDSEGNFRPDQRISREEAAVAITELMKFSTSDPTVLKGFEDGSEVDEKAVAAMSALVEAGLLIGDNGKLTPDKILTRSEMVTLLDRLFGTVYNMPGVYTGTLEGNVTIASEDVVLKDMVVKGNLYLAEGIGYGKLEVNNLTVKGDVIVKGVEKEVLTKGAAIEGQITVVSSEGAVALFDNVVALGQPEKTTSVKKNDSSNDEDTDSDEETLENQINVIASFEEGVPTFVLEADSILNVVAEGATEGTQALKVTYPVADFPSVKFMPGMPFDIW